MTYNMVTVRTAEFDDASFYPVLGIDPALIEFEAGDGGQVERLIATGVTVYENRNGQLVRLMGAREIKLEVFITDSRVAIACEKWDKGGGWRGWGLGGLVTSAALNAASHARAALRRRGKLLVGQVRYQWIKQVGFTAKTDWKSSERLRISVKDSTTGTARVLVLELAFPKGVSAEQIANRIARRGAQYRLASDAQLEPEERRKFELLSRCELLPPTPGSFVFHTFPTFFTANSKTVAPPHGISSSAAPAELPAGSSLATSLLDVLPAAITAAVVTPAGPERLPGVGQPPSAGCQHCGATNRAAAKFCSGCGAPLATRA